MVIISRDVKVEDNIHNGLICIHIELRPLIYMYNEMCSQYDILFVSQLKMS